MNNENPIGYIRTTEAWDMLCEQSDLAWEAVDRAYRGWDRTGDPAHYAAYKAVQELQEALDAQKQSFLDEWTNTGFPKVKAV